MERYLNERGIPVWKDVEESSPFSADMFHDVDMGFNPDGNTQLAFFSNLGNITVVNRLTSIQESVVRDEETVFRGSWLASNGCNVLDSECKTVGEAIS